MFNLYRRYLDAPWIGPIVEDGLQLLVESLALGQQIVSSAWPITLRSVVCASCDVAYM